MEYRIVAMPQCGGPTIDAPAPSETQAMTQQTGKPFRAQYDNIDELIAVLEPLLGGIWLATDVRTLVHWTVMADQVTPVNESPDDVVCRAFGVVTVCAPDGVPVFLINERDTLQWIEADQILAVRELGDVTCEIRLERLDDLDVQLVDAFNLPMNGADTLRTISAGNARHLQIYDGQLPTGCPDADSNLRMIEATIDARQRLVGPPAGTLDVLEQMAVDLDHTLRSCRIRSYIWAAVLFERIASARARLAA